MMIHPSHRTPPHADYLQWVKASIDAWKSLISLPSNTAAYRDCIEMFKSEYNSLKSTFANIPPFEELIQAMHYIFNRTRIIQINNTPQGQKQVDWEKTQFWIIIGGQKLDRGFTVKGLTVTYMPRPLGSGHADNLSQRARFFGYKKSYLGLCRVFLLSEINEAFEKYVKHEEFIHQSLQNFQGRPLKDWKRDFILCRRLNLTRPSVIGRRTTRLSFDGEWTTPKAIYKNSEAVKKNRELFNNLSADWSSRYGSINAGDHEEFKDKRANSPSNLLIKNVPLSEVLEHFLLEVNISDCTDSNRITALTTLITYRLQTHPNELCDIFLIGELKSQERDLDSGRINEVFQGRHSKKNDNSLIYVGDRKLFTSDRVILHLRKFDLKGVLNEETGEIRDIPWFAVRLPEIDENDVINEER